MRLCKTGYSELIDFEKEHNIELLVRERTVEEQVSISKMHGNSDKCRFTCNFEGAELMSSPPGTLESAYGEGDTIGDAMCDYMHQISGRTIVFDAYSERRREIEVPIFQKVWL
jgi:hypothetical protein